ncbi:MULTISPECIES: sigma-70 family RNA polymerase sigma factor [Pseudomonas]|uniref:Sigma-70 family RNA polymerase sigma factor n=1 Tax=Pseudomonas donghuensis TaxID=1163398 RepID=A0AAP0SI46_9PSED|nr:MULTISPECIES: sigma-70 family RNA polymerase sigma factor [Pseudomonas]MDF9894178.1 RNA polymerase sigma-70 factor (ECF subfamily) [Pseudomonas vranovensis]KDN98540.1 sigma-70 family RNA polymerase sigma factor [Pseudomonas donghuensis]MBS7596611.1 sigma-70 family RNA polymerase sigma factor [Pseudomonas sp. RC2C2]MCP6694800.1 sigma-70 family RNA polymerase sigma factor [Pseudomonas donghuensis]MCP6699562.1 sigma-70 family RNA polymerase sigma factor [Pseudomonas donghuensis]
MNELDDEQLRQMLERLRRFALWLTREASSADDLVQATVERALSRRGQQREDASLRAWLFSILYRQFIDGKRRERRQARWLAWFGRSEEAGSNTEDIVVAQLGLAAFAQLPTEQRALLLLVSVEGLSYKEAALALDVPIGTVMSRLSRARAAMRELAEGDTPPPALRRLK